VNNGKNNTKTKCKAKRVKQIPNTKKIVYTVMHKTIKHIYKVNIRNNKSKNTYKEYEVYTDKRYITGEKYKVVSIYSMVNKKVSKKVELVLRCTQVMVNKDVHVYLYSQSARENRRSKTYGNESYMSEKYTIRIKVINKKYVGKDTAGKIDVSVYVDGRKCRWLYIVKGWVRYMYSEKRKIRGKGKNGIYTMEKRYCISKGIKRCVTGRYWRGKSPKCLSDVHCSINPKSVSIRSYGYIPVLTKMSTAGRGEDDVEMADPALLGEKGACRFSHNSCLIKSCILLSVILTRLVQKIVTCRAVISLDCLFSIYAVYICPVIVKLIVPYKTPTIRPVIGKLNVRYKPSTRVNILGKCVPNKRVYVLGELLFISWCSRYGE